MKLLLPLILSLVLPLFVAAFVPSRNNLHGLLSCENYDSSTIRVTLSSLDSSFEDGLYSITSSEFGFSNQAIIKIPANVSWMNNILQYSPPSSIDPFFQNYVLLTFKCKLTERYLTSTKETAVLLRARIEGCCWLLLVVGCCWLLVVGCCCPTVLFFFISSTHPFFSLSLFFLFSFRIWSHQHSNKHCGRNVSSKSIQISEWLETLWE